ncbi:hypothetical protein [Nocardia terpenica]|uniref:hypothetical protein n=1 Tax=Nocardia terpenica TaxID=455432 RepID=UPI0018D557EA|nr:hypothetical protein [Nocardia terpenica]
MARSRRLKIPIEDTVRVVLSVLAGEMSAAEAARRRGVSTASVGKWKQVFPDRTRCCDTSALGCGHPRPTV